MKLLSLSTTLLVSLSVCQRSLAAPTNYLRGPWTSQKDDLNANPQQRQLLTSSPEQRAQLWLFQRGAADAVTANSTVELRQQAMAMVTFYYATGGPVNWTASENWLSYNVSECEWEQQAEPKDICGPSGFLQELEIKGYGLYGSLPSRMGDLFTLRVFDIEDNNGTKILTLVGMQIE